MMVSIGHLESSTILAVVLLFFGLFYLVSDFGLIGKVAPPICKIFEDFLKQLFDIIPSLGRNLEIVDFEFGCDPFALLLGHLPKPCLYSYLYGRSVLLPTSTEYPSIVLLSL